MVTIMMTGSRTWTDDKMIEHVFAQWLRERYLARPTGDERPVLRHGGAKGADLIAASIWKGWDLPTDEMRPDWSMCGQLCPGDGSCRVQVPGGEYCGKAGHNRNAAMIDKVPVPEVVFAFIHNASRGATQCASYAEERDVLVKRYLA